MSNVEHTIMMLRWWEEIMFFGCFVLSLLWTLRFQLRRMQPTHQTCRVSLALCCYMCSCWTEHTLSHVLWLVLHTFGIHNLHDEPKDVMMTWSMIQSHSTLTLIKPKSDTPNIHQFLEELCK